MFAMARVFEGIYLTKALNRKVRLRDKSLDT